MLQNVSTAKHLVRLPVQTRVLTRVWVVVTGHAFLSATVIVPVHAWDA